MVMPSVEGIWAHVRPNRVTGDPRLAAVTESNDHDENAAAIAAAFMQSDNVLMPPGRFLALGVTIPAGGTLQAANPKFTRLVHPGQDISVDHTLVMENDGATVRGVGFHGGRHPIDGDGHPLSVLVRGASGCLVEHVFVFDAEHGGIFLTAHANANIVRNSVVWGSGYPLNQTGAAIWVFRSSSDNIIEDNIVGGYTNDGIKIDDRTSGDDEDDGPCNDNIVRDNTVVLPRTIGTTNSGVVITGSLRNVVTGNYIEGCAAGVTLSEIQGDPPLPVDNNTVTGNIITGVNNGIVCVGDNNVLAPNDISAASNTYVDTGSGNTT